MVRILFFTILLLNTNLCWAGDDKFFINFSLTRYGQELEKGSLITSGKSKTWSKGLKRSFLRLSCKEVKGKTVKLLSTEDHFSGLLITHQHIGNQLHFKLSRTVVSPRAKEISQLKLRECLDMAPIVVPFQVAFNIEAKVVKGAILPLQDNVAFRYSIYRLNNHLSGEK